MPPPEVDAPPLALDERLRQLPLEGGVLLEEAVLVGGTHPRAPVDPQGREFQALELQYEPCPGDANSSLRVQDPEAFLLQDLPQGEGGLPELGIEDVLHHPGPWKGHEEEASTPLPQPG